MDSAENRCLVTSEIITKAVWVFREERDLKRYNPVHRKGKKAPPDGNTT